ncbi:MAG: Gfo/Idh/MocA family oxidoreductase, partial [Candidatus Puniceispirillum sp.]
MSKIRIGVAGANGAFGTKHLEALQAIPSADVQAVMATSLDKANASGDAFAVEHRFDDYDAMLNSGKIDAVILATPTQLHAEQAIKAMDAGLHVLVEIPMADNLADSERLVAKQQEAGLVGMAGHVRRFNPSHQWMHRRFQAGDLAIQQMDIQTYFFRRTNMNAKGEARSWTDHLLW